MDQTSHSRIFVERTLAIIKPDVVHKAEEIQDLILRSGFTVLQKRRLLLSPEQCSDFYADQYGKLFFPSLTAFMSSGPIVALTLARDNAIAHWKSIIGPASITKARETQPEWSGNVTFKELLRFAEKINVTQQRLSSPQLQIMPYSLYRRSGNLRAKYGTSDLKNALHGSESFHAAVKEIKFMFPNSVIEPFPSKEETEEYLSRYVNPVLLRGLTELCKEKPPKPCIWLADWLIKNNPNQPQICDGVIVEDEG